jgi:protein disulfide-isomerase A6
MARLSILFLALALPATLAMYSGSDDVVQLTSSSFNKEVGDGRLWLVEFYAPWCGHCKNLAPHWKGAATALKGFVNIAAVDATDSKNEPLASRFGVRGFPTIKIFSDGDVHQPKDYQGPRDEAGIIKYALSTISEVVAKRSGVGGGSGGGGGGGDNGPVVVLTDANFDDEVYNSDVPWLLEFYAPWCGHCKKLAPEWKEAAEILEEAGGGIKLGMMDATANSTAEKFGVRGFPTIKVMPAGSSRPEDADDYQGGRTSGAIVKFAETIAKIEPVVVDQAVSQATLENVCAVAGKTCIIGFLPNIMDGGKAAREKYLAVMNEVATKNRSGPFKFAWSQGGDQSAVEEKLGLSFGWPAVVAFNKGKGAYAVSKKPFDVQGVGTFLAGLTTGGTRSQKLKGEMPAFVEVQEWDGEDAPALEEEEFSLEDIMGEDF